MHRDLRQDILAVFVAACATLLAFTLLSYDPYDPLTASNGRTFLGGQPQLLAYPPHETVHNWCGPIGATLAHWLIARLGWGAYYVVASLIVIDVQLWRHRRPDTPVLRTVGWYVTILAVCTLAHLIYSPAPLDVATSVHSVAGPLEEPQRLTIGDAFARFGGGGAVGQAGAAFLARHFHTLGSWIISLSALVAGLLLSSDYLLFHVAWLVCGAAWARTPTAMRWAKRLGIRRRQMAVTNTDVETPAPSVPLPTKGGLSVRIGGKRLTDLDPATADVETSTEEEEWEEEEEEEYEYEDDGSEEDAEEEAEEPAEISEEAATATAVVAPEAPADALRVVKKNTKKKTKDTDERQEVIEQLEEASWQEEPVDNYELPDIGILLETEEISYDQQAKEVRRKAKILEKTFSDFGFNVKVVEIETGPVIAQYEVELEAGLRLSKITGLADDLAIALRAPSVRIVAPIPGKNTVGIEVPNEQRQLVRLREVMEESSARIKKMYIPLFLGKDVSGNALTVDLASLPHLLIAGRTGTGKSVCLNSIISSILMTRRPDEVRMLMIDPKMVELSGYRTLPHLMHPVVTDMRKAEAILAWAVDKMEERYELLARAGVRHIASYNQLGREELMDRLSEDEEGIKQVPLHLPFIVIVADEMADLMMTAGKEVEQHIIRLAQKSRAVGIHLILATQKPTVDVITGLIKSNLPARIAFQVASRTDSRVVLDEMGADKLLGNGDMLFLWPGTSTLLRGQGTYMSDDEINRIVDAVSTGEQDFVHELVQMKVENTEGESSPSSLKQRDELYEQAIDVVVRERRGSVSLLQRALGIGYGRAARLIDFMAEDGIVGPYNGSQAREIVLTVEQWEQMQRGDTPAPAANSPPAKPEPAAAKKNKILPLNKPENTSDAARTKPAPPASAPSVLSSWNDEDAADDDGEYDAAEYEEYEEEDYEEEASSEEGDDDEVADDEGDEEEGDEYEEEYEEDEYEYDDEEEYEEGEEDEVAEGDEAEDDEAYDEDEAEEDETIDEDEEGGEQPRGRRNPSSPPRPKKSGGQYRADSA